MILIEFFYLKDFSLRTISIVTTHKGCRCNFGDIHKEFFQKSACKHGKEVEIEEKTKVLLKRIDFF